jgi:enoyl-CoA hydratase/carnithine racemase
MTQKAHPLVAIEARDGVATLFFERADKRNALDRVLMDSIAGALDEVRDDPAVRVVVLRGRGPVFSSGIDHTFLLEVFQQSQSAPFAHLHADLQEVFNRLERMQKPIIAAMHRACIGMGLELALACDFRIVTEDCVLGLPEIAFGLVPDVGGTTRLVRAVGPVRAKELILLGELITARAAERLGLVTEVAGDEDDLAARAADLAARLAAHAPAAVGAAKALIHQSADVESSTSLKLEGTAQHLLLRQPDLAERFPRALQFIKRQVADLRR